MPFLGILFQLICHITQKVAISERNSKHEVLLMGLGCWASYSAIWAKWTLKIMMTFEVYMFSREAARRLWRAPMG